MKATLKLEPNATAWCLRALLGPAMLVDGLLCTLTLGTLHLGTHNKVARQLANTRYLMGTQMK